MAKLTSLKLRRLKAGLTALEVARDVGIHPSVLSLFENDWRVPPPEVLERIERVLARAEKQPAYRKGELAWKG